MLLQHYWYIKHLHLYLHMYLTKWQKKTIGMSTSKYSDLIALLTLDIIIVSPAELSNVSPTKLPSQ